MRDRLHDHTTAPGVDRVDDSEVATDGAVVTFELEPKSVAQPLRVPCERPVHELNDRRGHLLG